MPRLRKSLLWAGASVGLVAGVGAAAWLWWLPGKVRERAVEVVENRLGMQATIGEVSLKTRGVVLSDVRVQGNGGLDIAVGEVGVRASPWQLATRGGSAIEAIQVRGVSVEIDSGHSGFETTVGAITEARASGSPSTAGSDEGPVSGVAVELVGLSLTARDAVGALLSVETGRLTLSEGELDAAADQLEVGTSGTHQASIAAPHVSASRQEQGWVLTRFDVEAGDLTWSQAAPEPPEAEEPPDGEPTLDEEPTVEGPALDGGVDGGAGSELAQAPHADTGPEGVVERLLALADTFRSAIRGGAPDTEEADPPGGATEPAWRRRLADGAIVTAQELTVNTEVEGQRRPLLRRLRVEAEVTGPDELRLEGSGSAATGGSLGFRWTLAPEALRGEGTVTLEELPLALIAPLAPDLPWHRPDRARLDGELVVSAESAARLGVRGRVVVRGAALSAARISPRPIEGIDLSVEGTGAWIPAERRLEIAEMQLGLGDAAARVVGALEWAPDHYLVDLTATLPPTRCDTAVQAIPDDLLAEVAGFGFRGRIGGRVRALIDSRDLEHGRLDLRVADGCEFMTVPAVADLRRVRAPFLHRVVEPDGSVFEMTTGPGTGNWVSIHGVSPYFVHAVLAHEDAGFFRHGGFAPWAIRDALLRNLREGRYVVGASTITMQLAKNLFLHREKTLARKVQEVLLTWWLESSLEKREILELYLNVIEYGPGIYGIRNAAWHYFARDPEELSPAEAAFLATILPAPKRFHASYDEGALGVRMGNRVRRFLRHMGARGRLDEEALTFGLSEVDGMRFHREGAPLPPPRVVPGNAGALPFATVDTSGDEWDEFDEAEGFGEPSDEFDEDTAEPAPAG